jgi:hypothetical protein
MQQHGEKKIEKLTGSSKLGLKVEVRSPEFEFHHNTMFI